jgi:hypothetical protein
MDDTSRRNLSESLRSTAADLTGVADRLPSLTGDDDLKRHAEILDRTADDARQAASILCHSIQRHSILRSHIPARPPRRIPPDRTGTHPIPPDPGHPA